MADSPLICKQIPKIIEEIGPIAKSHTSTALKYSFRSIYDIYTALQPLLAKHKVFFVPEVLSQTREDRIIGKDTKMLITVLTIKYTFYAEDGSNIEAIVAGEAMDNSDKGCGKALTMALKALLVQIFCIPSQEADKDDTDMHSVEETSYYNSKPKQEAPSLVPGDKSIVKILNAFAPLAVSKASIDKYLGHDIKDSTDDEFSKLVDIWNNISAGKISKDVVFGRKEVTA